MSIGDLFGSLGNIIGKVSGSKLEEKYNGRILDMAVFRTDPGTGKLVQAAPNGSFTPYSSYLRVIINHMYVAEARRLWVEREHLGAVWLSLRYNDAVQAIPFTLGRDLLVDKIKNLPDGARIEFHNVQVGKIYPYNGDKLALYLGLWSTPTVNWASKAFSVLDMISSKVALASSLSQVIDVVGVLNEGISAVLGLDDIQAHLNLYQEFQDPSLGSQVGALQPGYYVMVNAPNNAFDYSTLRVIDDRLYVATNSNPPFVPYYDHDFLLYNISSLPGLPAAADIFRKQYNEVVKALIASKSNHAKLAEAAYQYHTLQAQIGTSPDLTMTEVNQLLDFYKATLDADKVRFAIQTDQEDVPFAVTEMSLPAELQAPSQEAYEAYVSRLDQDAMRNANPKASAGNAAMEFANILQAISSEQPSADGE